MITRYFWANNLCKGKTSYTKVVSILAADDTRREVSIYQRVLTGNYVFRNILVRKKSRLVSFISYLKKIWVKSFLI